MQTTPVDESLRGLTDAQKRITLAMGIVVERISSLSKDDRNDLFELFQGMADADGEGLESIYRTMLEILAQPTSASKPLPGDESPTPKLTNWMNHVAARIRKLRKKAGLSQSDLAARAGLPQSHISRLENAEHSATHKTLQKIAEALGVDVGELDPCVD